MTLSKITTRTLFAAIAALSATGTVVSNANACGGEWYPYVEIEQIDYRPMVVGQAEKRIENGELQIAAGMIIRSWLLSRVLKSSFESSANSPSPNS